MINFFRLLLMIIVWAILISCALFVLGIFLRSVPYLGLGSLVMPSLPLLFLVVAYVSGMLILSGSRNPSIKKVAVSLSILTIAGTVFISIRMASAFSMQGANVNIFSTAGLCPELPKADTTVQFGTYDGQALYADVYKPSGKHTGPAPVLVYIHGGGWVGNTRRESSAEHRWFAEKGWLVFSIDYTLSTETKHYWNSVHSQVGCFLAWLSPNAGKYGGDLRKLVLSGASAGGNLALNVASLSNQQKLSSTCGGQALHVAAVVAVAPSVDAAVLTRNDDPVLGPTLRNSIPYYLGGLPEEYPERYKSINSSTYLSVSTPPTLIFSGLSDHYVTHESIDTYAVKAKKMGVQLKLVRIPFADHLIFGEPGTIPNKGYRQVMFNWLSQLGLAPANSSL